MKWRLGENDANHEGDKHRRPKQIYDLPAGVGPLLRIAAPRPWRSAGEFSEDS